MNAGDKMVRAMNMAKSFTSAIENKFESSFPHDYEEGWYDAEVFNVKFCIGSTYIIVVDGMDETKDVSIDVFDCEKLSEINRFCEYMINSKMWDYVTMGEHKR